MGVSFDSRGVEHFDELVAPIVGDGFRPLRAFRDAKSWSLFISSNSRIRSGGKGSVTGFLFLVAYKKMRSPWMRSFVIEAASVILKAECKRSLRTSPSSDGVGLVLVLCASLRADRRLAVSSPALPVKRVPPPFHGCVGTSCGRPGSSR